MSTTAWLQSPSPVFVMARYRNCVAVPTGSPVIVVDAFSVPGVGTQVLPPSTLYCHSYDARRDATTAVIFTEPETVPGLARKACVEDYYDADKLESLDPGAEKESNHCDDEYTASMNAKPR